MATDATLVIDGRSHGLPDAPGFYAAFPREPSPLGELTLSAKATIVMGADCSLSTTLDALAKGGPGGAAVLVCHAWTDGLFMPVAPNGSAAMAKGESLDSIDKLLKAESGVAIVRAGAKGTKEERKAFLKGWADFLNGLQSGTVTGDPTDDELGTGFDGYLRRIEKLYDDWIRDGAKRLEFGSVAGLRTLLSRVRAMRQAKLARLELRACVLGLDQTAMDRLRRFMGADKLTAPMRETFFGHVPLGTLLKLERTPGPRGASRRPAPAGSPDSREQLAALDKMTDSPSTRGFVPFAVIPVATGPSDRTQGTALHLGALSTTFRFVLRVERPDPDAFDYKLWAWVHGIGTPPTPDPATVAKFVQGSIMPGAGFSGSMLPVAGLWTPDMPGQPYVLANEADYTKLIAVNPVPKAP